MMKGLKHMKSKIRRIELSVLFGLIITVILSTVSFARDCSEIRNSVLRMHVIANSDSDADQELKLKVRDAVLQAGKEYFDGSITASQAEEKLIPVKEKLEQAARQTIEENGFDYSVRVTICKEYFGTRTYDNDITLPAGQYEAVKVIIGEGKGHNWWCVMFPPMCLPAAESDAEIDSVLSDSELSVVKSNPKFEPRFKIIELFEKFAENVK